tara:strand:+ start:448 stop:1137 length:690 start_codon:yes stop_codon:yes gene_type:complete
MKKIIGKKTSVIIRTRNEERWIGHAIQSVLEFLPGCEIIIVDNNSTDETLMVCKMFLKPKVLKNVDSSYTDIKLEKIVDYTPGKALNKGIKVSSRENILILSSHCVIKNINYEKLNKDLKKYAGIFGNQIPVYKGKKIQKRYIWSNFKNDGSKINLFSDIENRYFFHNAFSFFKSKILKKFPFEEELSGKEDRYWAKMIVDNKLNYLYEPDHIVEHYYTKNGNTWRGLG